MDNETKRCPFCGEEIMKAAKKCKYCGEWLEKSKEEVSMTKSCSVCNNEVSLNAVMCVHCGEKLYYANRLLATCQDDLPLQLRRFNWGAFFLSIIWGLFNGMPKKIIIRISILMLFNFVPFLNYLVGLGLLGIHIWAGIQGNVWAWNSKNWESTEKFNEYQCKWITVYLVGGACIGVLLMAYLFLGLAIGTVCTEMANY